MLQSISMENALKIIQEYASTVGSEEIAVVDSFERILAEDVAAGFPLPPFRRSPLDGYALRAEDIAQASSDHPVTLRIVEAVYAGCVPSRPLRAGEVMAITTGAPLPEGGDCVIKFEDTEREGDSLTIHHALRKGQNVIPQGEDVISGEKVLEKGANITPAVVGVLVSLGLETIRVFKRPRVGIISIGDELLTAGQPLQPGKIYNSNLYALAIQIREAGGLAFPEETVPDNTEVITQSLDHALGKYDIVITTGGASVGSKDLVREAIGRSGTNILFWKIGMKPGTPAVCGERDGKLVIGLSGNPSAAMITFLMLARPIIRSMAGKKCGELPVVSAVMAEPFRKKSMQRRLLRSVLNWKDGSYRAVPAGIQSPGALKSMMTCNALIDIPAGHDPLQVGEEVRAFLLPPAYCLQG